MNWVSCACAAGIACSAASTTACDSPIIEVAMRPTAHEDDAGTPEATRSVYQACEAQEECPGEDSLCAAYGSEPGSSFCASYCESDAACPAMPGFQTVCNFAWCAVRCDEGACPHGMKCVPDQHLIDHNGEARGDADICVTDIEE